LRSSSVSASMRLKRLMFSRVMNRCMAGLLPTPRLG
jgi:hypothetical protein